MILLNCARDQVLAVHDFNQKHSARTEGAHVLDGTKIERKIVFHSLTHEVTVWTKVCPTCVFQRKCVCLFRRKL